MPYILHHGDCVFKDSVGGGSCGAIYRKYMTGSYYNDDIAMQTIQLWLQVKRVKKLRNKYTAKKRAEERYHTCYKFDCIWKFIVHNVIFLTEKADINLYGDDTIFVTALYWRNREMCNWQSQEQV